MNQRSWTVRCKAVTCPGLEVGDSQGVRGATRRTLSAVGPHRAPWQAWRAAHHAAWEGAAAPPVSYGCLGNLYFEFCAYSRMNLWRRTWNVSLDITPDIFFLGVPCSWWKKTCCLPALCNKHLVRSKVGFCTIIRIGMVFDKSRTVFLWEGCRPIPTILSSADNSKENGNYFICST